MASDSTGKIPQFRPYPHLVTSKRLPDALMAHADPEERHDGPQL